MNSKTKAKATSGWMVGLTILVFVALGCSIAALVLMPQDEEDRAFALYDNGTQTLDGASLWTDIHFHNNIRLDGSGDVSEKKRDVEEDSVDDWKHARGSARVIAKHDDTFTMSLSVQAGLVTPPTAAPTETPTAAPTVVIGKRKKRMHEEANTEAPTLVPAACTTTTFYIRAVRQAGGTGDFVEVPGSLTWTSHTPYLSKTFLVAARTNDVFKYQWFSTCAFLVLTPIPLSEPYIGALALDGDSTFPSSATLLIE